MSNQEPRKGGLAKGVSAESSVTPKQTKENPGILDPAVHLALRAPRLREAYISAKTPFEKPFRGFFFQKNPCAHRKKSALPPPKTQNTPPPLKRGILWARGFPAERTQKKTQAPIKLGRPFPAPELQAKFFLRTPPDLCLPRCVFRDCPCIW